MKRLIAAMVCVGFAGAGIAQGPGAGAGTGPGPGKGQGQGQGQGQGMHGMGMKFGSSNTSGWSMMSKEERKEHHDKMMSAKTMGECTALHDDHRKIMEQRAKDKNTTLPQPKHNPCEMMQKRGAFK
jgi:hypothetical protein